jgi:hypothetical protein
MAVPGLDPGINPAIQAHRYPRIAVSGMTLVAICFYYIFMKRMVQAGILTVWRLDGRVKPGYDTNQQLTRGRAEKCLP